MTQKRRVLRALQAFGSTGLNTTDFLLPDVIDGGLPILRVGARVEELRREGYEISTRRLPNGVAKYVLVGSSVVEGTPGGPACHGERASSGVPSTTEPTALFDESVGAPRPRSHYEEAA